MDVTVAGLKADLSRILRKAEAGEPVCVTRHGKAIVRLVPAEGAGSPGEKRRRGIGAIKDEPFFIADDFDDLGPEWDAYIAR